MLCNFIGGQIHSMTISVDTATWQVFKEMDWSSMIGPEMRSPMGRLLKSFSGIPFVEVPCSISVKSLFGLPG